jgi:hypothetical protein
MKEKRDKNATRGMLILYLLLTLVGGTAVVWKIVDVQFVDGDMWRRKAERHEVKWQDLPRNANAQFLRFYEQFAADTVFQHQSLADQIVFSGPDPDDDFSTIDGVITPDFWEAFRPELPQHILYNMVYGRQDPAATHKILLVRGIANGLEVEITFRLHKGRWKLTKLLT